MALGAPVIASGAQLLTGWQAARSHGPGGRQLWVSLVDVADGHLGVGGLVTFEPLGIVHQQGLSDLLLLAQHLDSPAGNLAAGAWIQSIDDFNALGFKFANGLGREEAAHTLEMGQLLGISG